MPKAKPERPLDKRMALFVKFHLGDKYAFAPFTGQDFSAWKAFLYALELYGRGDAKGRESAIEIMTACIDAAQRKDDVLAIFKKSIPGVLDWGFEVDLWPQIAPIVTRAERERVAWLPYTNADGAIAWPCSDGPRICSHIHSKPHKTRPGWFVCKDPVCKEVWKLDDDGGSAVCPL